METVFHLPKTTFIGGKETALPLKEIITDAIAEVCTGNHYGSRIRRMILLCICMIICYLAFLCFMWSLIFERLRHIYTMLRSRKFVSGAAMCLLLGIICGVRDNQLNAIANPLQRHGLAQDLGHICNVCGQMHNEGHCDENVKGKVCKRNKEGETGKGLEEGETGKGGGGRKNEKEG